MEENMSEDIIFKILHDNKDIKRGEMRELICPKCGNKITLLCSKENGHKHIWCESENCIGFHQ